MEQSRPRHDVMPVGRAELAMEVGTIRPRLLYVITEDWFFCSHFLPMARAARAAGWDVGVVARYDRHREIVVAEGLRPIDLRWERESLGPFRAARDVLGLLNLFRREKPDLVHAIALRPVLLGGMAARAAGVPRFVAAMTGLGYLEVARQPAARLLRWLVLRGLHAIGTGRRTSVLVENRDHEAAFLKAGTPAERLVRLPGAGVDTERFRAKPLPDRTPVTAMLVARLIAIKGVAEAVAAVRRLADAGVPIRLRLVGEPDPRHRDSIDTDRLRAWAEHPAIEWLGRSTDVAALWAEADIGLLAPLGGDGLPKSLLEAAACGRPIVTSDTAGCREVVVEGENGFVAPPGDVDALAAALRRLVEDWPLRRRMGATSRARAEQEFSDRIIDARMRALYERLHPTASLGTTTPPAAAAPRP